VSRWLEINNCMSCGLRSSVGVMRCYHPKHPRGKQVTGPVGTIPDWCPLPKGNVVDNECHCWRCRGEAKDPYEEVPDVPE
jgi:hypothetical protein